MILNSILVGLGHLPSPGGWHVHDPHQPGGHAPAPIADSADDAGATSTMPPSLKGAIEKGSGPASGPVFRLPTVGHSGSGLSGPVGLHAKDDPVTRKLRKAGQDFESQLISSWWDSMKSSGLPGGEDELDPGADTLNNMASQAMSSVVAAQGGFGLSNFMVSRLQEEQSASAPAATQP
jgi:hypothetical protein